MEKNITVCDICGKEIEDSKKVFQVPVKSSRFITYANFDTLFADRKKIDVCLDCVIDFKEFIHYKRGEVKWEI